MYKQVGPALLAQSVEEAKANVDKRLMFMRSKIKDLDTRLEAASKAMNDSKTRFMKLQATVRQVREEQQRKAMAQQQQMQQAQLREQQQQKKKESKQ